MASGGAQPLGPPSWLPQSRKTGFKARFSHLERLAQPEKLPVDWARIRGGSATGQAVQGNEGILGLIASLRSCSSVGIT